MQFGAMHYGALSITPLHTLLTMEPVKGIPSKNGSMLRISDNTLTTKLNARVKPTRETIIEMSKVGYCVCSHCSSCVIALQCYFKCMDAVWEHSID